MSLQGQHIVTVRKLSTIGKSLRTEDSGQWARQVEVSCHIKFLINDFLRLLKEQCNIANLIQTI